MKVILLILVAVINSFVLADVDHVDHLPTAKQQALSSLNAALNHPKGHEATSFQSTDAKPVNLVERKRASAVPESLTASKGGDNSVNYVTMGNQIVCNGKPYHVRGVCYSPAPIGINPQYTAPFGDYFTAEYSALWERDFPLIAAMGANTIRVYGLQLKQDHKSFLDTADKYGLKVILTFYLGTAEEIPVSTIDDQQKVIDDFTTEVAAVSGHTAVLAWSFGNELNGVWNGFLQAFNRSNSCGWNDGENCYGKSGGDCSEATACVYKAFYGFINRAASSAHQAMGVHKHLVISSFADTDVLADRVKEFGLFLPDLDAFGAQLYRGKTFGEKDLDFLANWPKASPKPLIITEYGVDSYSDPCGNNTDTVCMNTEGRPHGGFDDEILQAEWNQNLAGLIDAHNSASGKGSVAGGCIMAWVDEWWKNAVNVKGCTKPGQNTVQYGEAGFDLKKCDYKAHVDCPATDITQPALCGYQLDAPFDRYVNEGYFGLMRPIRGGVKVDRIQPKLAYAKMKELWSPNQPDKQVWPWLATSVTAISVITTAVVFYISQYSRPKSAFLTKGVNNGGGYGTL